MYKTLRNLTIAAVAGVGLAVGTSGAANAQWGWHHHHWHHWWGGPRLIVSTPAYGYVPGCIVRRTVHFNRWGERVVRRVRVCD